MSLESGKVGIALIGMPGSGKTAIGKRVQKKGWIFHDQDNDGFESPSIGLGKDGVAKKLHELGDTRFLQFENDFTIKNYGTAREKKNFHLNRMILSASGSLPRSPEAMKYIHERMHVILLDMPIEVVLENIRKRSDGASRIIGMNGGPDNEAPMHISLEEELTYRQNIYQKSCDSVFLYRGREEVIDRAERFREFIEQITGEHL